MDLGDVNAIQIRLMTVEMRQKIITRALNLIDRLKDKQLLKGVPVQMTEVELNNNCCLLQDVLGNEPTCLELDGITVNSTLFVVGDLFGQFGHLLRLFDKFGFPPEKRYLFLGNYASNNTTNTNIEVLALLFAYKLCYPKSIYLLRGRHECVNLARTYGLYDECVKRFSRRLWSSIVGVFGYLPPAALIHDQIFCVHSGLSPNFYMNELTDLNKFKDYCHTFITKPVEIDPNNVTTHLLWSDPDETVKNWAQNPIGMGYLFGLDVVKKFCNRLDLALVIRSGELILKGFDYFQDHRLLTIYTAPDFQEYYANDASLVQIQRNPKDQNLRIKIHILKPIIKLRSKSTLKMNMIFEDVIYDLMTPSKCVQKEELI